MAGLSYPRIILQWRAAEIFTDISFQSFAPSPTKETSTQIEKSILAFNDFPEVVTQLRDEVMSPKSLLAKRRSVNSAKTADTHVPMPVDEAAEYSGILKGTLYMKLLEGAIPATKLGKRYCPYRDELDKWLETVWKSPIPLSDEGLNKSLSSSHCRKPNLYNW